MKNAVVMVITYSSLILTDNVSTHVLTDITISQKVHSRHALVALKAMFRQINLCARMIVVKS